MEDAEYSKAYGKKESGHHCISETNISSKKDKKLNRIYPTNIHVV
jgi:hypothetical protein